MYFVHWAIWCHHISVWTSRVGRQCTLTRQFYLFINITRTPSSASGLSCEPFYITIFPSADLYVERVFIRETYLSCSYTSNKPGLPLVNCLLQGWPAFVLSTKKMGLKGEKNMSKTLRRLWRNSISYAGKATKTIPMFFLVQVPIGLALGQSFQFIWKIWAKFKNSIDPCHHRTWLIWIKLLQAWSTANTQNIFRWKSQLIYSNFTLNNLWTLGFPKVIFLFLRSVSAQFYPLHVELRQVVTVLLSRIMNFSSTSLSPVSSAFFSFFSLKYFGFA